MSKPTSCVLSCVCGTRAARVVSRRLLKSPTGYILHVHVCITTGRRDLLINRFLVHRPPAFKRKPRINKNKNSKTRKMSVPATTSSRTNKKGSGGGPAQPSGAAVRPTAPAQFSASAMPFQATAAHQQAVMFSIHSEKKVVLLENVHNAFNAAHLPSITFTISGQISPITDFNTLATNSLPQRLGEGPRTRDRTATPPRGRSRQSIYTWRRAPGATLTGRTTSTSRAT